LKLELFQTLSKVLRRGKIVVGEAALSIVKQKIAEEGVIDYARRLYDLVSNANRNQERGQTLWLLATKFWSCVMSPSRVNGSTLGLDTCTVGLF